MLDEAAFVVAGVVPINILANEMERLHSCKLRSDYNSKERRKKERARTIRLWQERCDNSHKRRERERTGRFEISHLGNVHYQLNQFLAGYGTYRRCLHRFGHDNSSFCPECVSEFEDPEYILFVFRRFVSEWEQLEPLLRRTLQVETIIWQMLELYQLWNPVSG